MQYACRLHRLYPGKTEVHIYDYVDRDVPMLAQMLQKPLRGYHAIGDVRGPAPARREEVDAQALESFETPAVAE